MRTAIIISLILFSLSTAAQSTSRFKTVGSAIPLSDSCFRMTPALVNQSGSVWYDTRIDLRQNFVIECEINLGGLDQDGADGIAFVLQPLSTDLGSTGAGMGYAGIVPSIAIEFDTWQNASDPAFDHIALVRDGNATHNTTSTIFGPIEMLPGGANAEDRQNRLARFEWDAANQRLKCFFDGQLKFDQPIDLINTVFRGNPYVFWGFTAATGGFFNDQRVCFFKFTFVEECPTAKITAMNPVCIGDSLILKGTGGKKFSWTGPSGFSSADSIIAFNSVSTAQEGLYRLITEDSICIDTATIDIVVKPRTIALITGTDPLCEGDSLVLQGSGGVQYSWTGPANFTSSSSTVIINRTSIANAGQYRLIADNGACLDTAFTDVVIWRSPWVISKDTIVEPRSTIILELETSPDVNAWLWSPADQLSCTNCPSPTAVLLRDGEYILRVRNADGCTDTGTYRILFKCDLKNIYIPNAFTPNLDGLNDIFYPMGSGIRRVRSFRIFSRWGDMVFEKKDFPANNRNFGWDGTVRSKEPVTGLYTYLISIECSEGQILELKGTVSLIR